MTHKLKSLVAAAALLFAGAAAQAAEAIKIAVLQELSGAGATAGTNAKNGVMLAIKEINEAGGILGRKLEAMVADTQSNPGVAKGLASKAVDDDVFAVMGPTFSGSIMVSMAETKRAEIPNFTGGEAASVTQQGNPYIFRTSFGQATSMPKVARYIANGLKAKTVAIIYVNNDFGKGGRDSFVKEMNARGIKVAADISTESGQVDFAADVVKVKNANADCVFIYTNEEESARFLREARKQGVKGPLLGETTLLGQKVIELAGDAANGVRGHVGLSADIPVPAVQEFKAKFNKRFGYFPDHNGIKGYSAVYAIKYATTKIGKFDRKLLAKTLHGMTITPAMEPGILIETTWDEHGDIDRISFLAEVVDGKQKITQTLPKLGK